MPRPSPPNEVSPFWTPAEVARYLRIHRRTIYRLLESGEIEGVRIGDSWRIPAAQFDKLPQGSPKPR